MNLDNINLKINLKNKYIYKLILLLIHTVIAWKKIKTKSENYE